MGKENEFTSRCLFNLAAMRCCLLSFWCVFVGWVGILTISSKCSFIWCSGIFKKRNGVNENAITDS